MGPWAYRENLDPPLDKAGQFGRRLLSVARSASPAGRARAGRFRPFGHPLPQCSDRFDITDVTAMTRIVASEDVMFTWRLLVEEGRKAGHTFAQPDLIIAATALHHGLTVVSRDITDYTRAGVSVFNPWSG